MKPNSKSARRLGWAVAILFIIAAVVQFGACIYSWFFGDFDFYVGPLRVRLTEWVEAWHKGMGFLLAAVLLRPGPFFSLRTDSRETAGKTGDTGPSPKSWFWFGGAIGFGMGLFTGSAYEYVFSLFAYKLLLALLFAVLSGGLHFLWAKLFALISRFLDPAYVRGICWGFYLLLWSAFVVGPLRLWEGRFVDPLWMLISGVGGFMLISLLVRFAFHRLSSSTRKVAVAIAVLFVAGVLAASFISGHKSLHPSESPRDRILIITLDTTRADHLSCYGYRRKTSPFVDFLADSGARFDMAFAPIGKTDPSHASMFTGAYPRSHGCFEVGYPITGNVASLAEYFQRRGYSTAAIVSRYQLGPAGSLNLPGFDYENVPVFNGEQTSAPLAFRRAANWLTRHRDENIFIWVHFFDPHTPYKPHPELETRFARSNKPVKPKDFLEEDEKIDEETVEEIRNIYDEEILYMDHWVEKLVEWTKKLEPEPQRPPLLALVGDHGEVLGELQDHKIRFGFGHGAIIYNSVLHIPFIINWPGRVKQGAVVNGITETIDLAPTIVELVFKESDFAAQGKSLVPLMEGRQAERPELAFAQRGKYDYSPDRPWLSKEGYAVYKDSFKLLVRSYDEQELYNMDTDINETNNLAAKNPDKVEELLQELEDWKKRTPLSRPMEKKYNEQERRIFKALGYVK